MARTPTNFARFEGNEELIALQKRLPLGITINCNQFGELTYTVRVSEGNPVTGQKRITVGTFSSVPVAIRAQLDYKYRGFLTKEYFDSIDTLIVKAKNSLIVQAQQENVKKLQDATARLGVATKKAMTAVETERALSAASILDSMPPHEIPTEGDWHLNHPVTGEPIVILASSIAAWFKLQETQASSTSGSGESFSGISHSVTSTAHVISNLEAYPGEAIDRMNVAEQEEQAERLRAAAFFATTPLPQQE